SGLPTPNSRLPTCTFSAWTYRPRPSAARPCTYHVDPRPASAFNDSHGNQHHWTALETVKHHLKPIRQGSVGLRQQPSTTVPVCTNRDCSTRQPVVSRL